MRQNVAPCDLSIANSHKRDTLQSIMTSSLVLMKLKNTLFTATKLTHCLSLSLALNFSVSAFTFANAEALTKNDNAIEVITVTNQGIKSSAIDHSYAQGKTTTPDLADWLKSIPGANVNRNGPVTGIAQFRGLYGDRVSTTIDGQVIIGAGPNAMDTPLSYSTPLMVESMTTYRGIAPVSAGMNTLGGAIDVKMRKAEINHQQGLSANGDIQTGYRFGNEASTFAAVTNLSKGDIGLMIYGNAQQGDNFEDGDNNKITPTEFSKQQYGLDMRYDNNDVETGFAYHYTDTTDSGTPALPMDIEFIYSNRFTFDGSYQTTTWAYHWRFGYLDADHAMTNFQLRENNNLNRFRRNNADSDSFDFKLSMDRTYQNGTLIIGLDGYQAVHSSLITNPNNMMFEVVNFNDVQDNRYGLFAQWHQSLSSWDVQAGARLKHSQSDAGDVSTSMAMMMGNMGMMASSLQDDFNKADRNINDTNLDLAMSLQNSLSDELTAYIGLGLKNRAPSYQERYLWTPMESTGGLADGNTYIGDINLDSETAFQADLGLTYSSNKFLVSTHVYFQNINNYIQGTPLTMEDMTASMMAMMMAGDNNPLKFTNVDAKLYGADLNWNYQANEWFSVSGITSYVRGERRDVIDNLYRIAPLNTQINLTYLTEQYSAKLNITAVAAQNEVSRTNAEAKTAGYALLNIEGQYHFSSDLSLRVGIDNLLDKAYSNHLGGYNRVKGSDIPIMKRLPSEGVSAWLELGYSF